MEKFLNKKVYVGLVVFFIILVVITGLYLVLSRIEKEEIGGAKFVRDNKETVQNKEGLPLEDNPIYEKLGFDRVPELAQLQKAVGNDHGSEIISISHVSIGETTWAKLGIVFVDPNIEGGVSEQVVFYKFENQTQKWKFIENISVPDDVRQNL